MSTICVQNVHKLVKLASTNLDHFKDFPLTRYLLCLLIKVMFHVMQYLTTVIPYQSNEGPPFVEKLQIFIRSKRSVSPILFEWNLSSLNFAGAEFFMVCLGHVFCFIVPKHHGGNLVMFWEKLEEAGNLRWGRVDDDGYRIIMFWEEDKKILKTFKTFTHPSSYTAK